jgi:hypothetical protein
MAGEAWRDIGDLDPAGASEVGECNDSVAPLEIDAVLDDEALVSSSPAT